jgi:ribonucleoside-diphosphate reductase alpha chain
MDEQLCNLTEVVIRPSDTYETIAEKVRAAVLLGCVQSKETNFNNVSDGWKNNAEDERLIGVSLTGVCDNKLFRKVDEKTKQLLAKLKDYAHECSTEFAKALSINAPKQVTLNKPSGTVSQLCNCSSGIHPRYSDYYIRRVRVTAKDPISYLLLSKNVPCNPEVGQTWDEYNTLVYEFPMKSPRGSLTREDFTAIEQLEYWKMFNDYWCDGNPSCSIYVKPDEWIEVGSWVYKNWDSICGLSFFPYDGSVYPLAPYEEISKEEYFELAKLFSKIDIDFDSELNQFEQDDNTTGAQTLACSGGSCEL